MIQLSKSKLQEIVNGIYTDYLENKKASYAKFQDIFREQSQESYIERELNEKLREWEENIEESWKESIEGLEKHEREQAESQKEKIIQEETEEEITRIKKELEEIRKSNIDFLDSMKKEIKMLKSSKTELDEAGLSLLLQL